MLLSVAASGQHPYCKKIGKLKCASEAREAAALPQATGARSRLNGLQRALPHREEECRRWASTAIEDALACARVPGGTGWDNGQRGE